MTRLISYLRLPQELSTFERSYLTKCNRIALCFFFVHLPVLVAFAGANGSDPERAALFTLGMLVAPTVAYFTVHNPRVVSVVLGITAMGMGGVLVHMGQGPVQVETHFYFFALIAMLALFGNPLVIVSAAVTVAAHQLLLWFILPQTVFNDDAAKWAGIVHAGFMVLELVGAIYLARTFFDNVIGIQNLIAHRTTELLQRQADMRLVIDNVGQGLATIDRAGRMSSERSARFDQWFGSPAPSDMTVFDLFERSCPDFAERARFGWSQVDEALLPLELTLEQMPSRLALGKRTYEVRFRPIGEGETPERFLVVVADVTELLAAEQADVERREAMVLVERMLTDRATFIDFFEEASGLVSGITAGVDADADDVATMKRSIHTLKGNCALSGLMSVAELCHRIEDWMEAEGAGPRASDVYALRTRWGRLAAEVERLVGNKSRLIAIGGSTHDALERAVRRQASTAELLRMVHDLRLDPTDRWLRAFAEQAEHIARRLGKHVEVLVEGGDLKLDARHWSSFWGAFIHAVRNTVDHGSEPTEKRLALGKPERARIELRTRMRDRRFVVEILDDGPGISWDRIAEKAAARGLPVDSEKDLHRALFSGGISTACQLSEVSGRGVGMSALYETTRLMGGDIEIVSERGRGTQVRFVFPAAMMSPEFRPFVSPSRPPAAA